MSTTSGPSSERRFEGPVLPIEKGEWSSLLDALGEDVWFPSVFPETGPWEDLLGYTTSPPNGRRDARGRTSTSVSDPQRTRAPSVDAPESRREIIHSYRSGNRIRRVMPVKRLYNQFVRERLPVRPEVYHGVAVPEGRFLDTRWHYPDTKRSLLSTAESLTNPGDEVLVLGGGMGLAATIAARRCLPDGAVVVVEAAPSQVERTRRTVEYNGVGDYVEIVHGVVGDTTNVRGDVGDAEVLGPEDLPDADVWIVDIDGGEVGFFEEAVEDDGVSWPDHVVIETHPDEGSFAEGFRRLLDDRYPHKRTLDGGRALGGPVLLLSTDPITLSP